MGLAHRGRRGRLGNCRHGVWEGAVRSSRREEEVSRHLHDHRQCSELQGERQVSQRHFSESRSWATCLLLMSGLALSSAANAVTLTNVKPGEAEKLLDRAYVKSPVAAAMN